MALKIDDSGLSWDDEDWGGEDEGEGEGDDEECEERTCVVLSVPIFEFLRSNDRQAEAKWRINDYEWGACLTSYYKTSTEAWLEALCVIILYYRMV